MAVQRRDGGRHGTLLWAERPVTRDMLADEPALARVIDELHAELEQALGADRPRTLTALVLQPDLTVRLEALVPPPPAP